MSLLTICQDVAYELGIGAPTSIVGSTDTNALQLLRLANKEGEDLSQKTLWQVLTKEHTFTLDGLTPTQTYDMPADFRSIIPSTTWNRDNKRVVINPVSPAEWQFLKGWTTISGLNLRAHFRGDQLEFQQTLTSADDGKTIAFEYLSKYWSETSGGTAQQKFAADTDVPKLDAELITQGIVWRFKKEKGLDWQPNYQEYTNLRNSIIARDGGARVVNMGRGEFGGELGVNVSDRGFG